MSTCVCVVPQGWEDVGGRLGQEVLSPQTPCARAELQGAWESKLNFPGCEDTFVKESVFYLTVSLIYDGERSCTWPCECSGRALEKVVVRAAGPAPCFQTAEHRVSAEDETGCHPNPAENMRLSSGIRVTKTRVLMSWQEPLVL